MADHKPIPKGTASDPFTGSGAYVSGSGGVEASRFTGTKTIRFCISMTWITKKYNIQCNKFN